MGGHEILQSPTLEGRGIRWLVHLDRCLERDGVTVAHRSLIPTVRVRIPVPLLNDGTAAGLKQVEVNVMPSPQEIQRALDIHGQAYLFIDWLRNARCGDVLRLDQGHRKESDLNFFDSAASWLEYNEDRIPSSLVPSAEDRKIFVSMLVSFRMTSGDYDLAYRERKMSQYWKSLVERVPAGNFCECEFCDRFVWRLGNFARNPEGGSGRAALLLKQSALRALLKESQLPLVEGDLPEILKRRGMFDNELSIWTYAWELVRRCDYEQHWYTHRQVESGVLLLWRRIARNRQGKISPEFLLTVERILAARDHVVEALQRTVKRRMA